MDDGKGNKYQSNDILQTAISKGPWDHILQCGTYWHDIPSLPELWFQWNGIFSNRKTRQANYV